MGAPTFDGGEATIIRKRLVADGVTQTAPVVVVTSGECEPVVIQAAIDVVRHVVAESILIALWVCFASIAQKIGKRWSNQIRPNLQLREVNPLPDACPPARFQCF